MRVLFLLLVRVILYFFKKKFGFVNGGNIIYLFLLIIAVAPFFTVICTEMLLYSFPLIILLMYVTRITMSSILFEEADDEQHEFFLRCCEISVWKMTRMVYAYRYGHSLIVLLYGLLFSYLNILDYGQKVQNEQYIKLCRAFSIRRYNCLLAKSRI